MGSSEEIDSYERYLGILSPRPTTSMENKGDMHDLVASESLTAPCRTTPNPIADNDDHGITLLTSGQSECNYPLGNSNSPRTLDKKQKAILEVQIASLGRQATATYQHANSPKQGEFQCIGYTTHAAGEQLRHGKGNQEKGEQ